MGAERRRIVSFHLITISRSLKTRACTDFRAHFSNKEKTTNMFEGKTWEGMAGKDPEEVKAAILAEDSSLEVAIMAADAPATMDLRFNRVRILVGEDGKVIADPSQG